MGASFCLSMLVVTGITSTLGPFELSAGDEAPDQLADFYDDQSGSASERPSSRPPRIRWKGDPGRAALAGAVAAVSSVAATGVTFGASAVLVFLMPVLFPVAALAAIAVPIGVPAAVGGLVVASSSNATATISAVLGAAAGGVIGVPIGIVGTVVATVGLAQLGYLSGVVPRPSVDTGGDIFMAVLFAPLGGALVAGFGAGLGTSLGYVAGTWNRSGASE